jgi:hypothetical protein
VTVPTLYRADPTLVLFFGKIRLFIADFGMAEPEPARVTA